MLSSTATTMSSSSSSASSAPVSSSISKATSFSPLSSQHTKPSPSTAPFPSSIATALSAGHVNNLDPLSCMASDAVKIRLLSCYRSDQSPKMEPITYKSSTATSAPSSPPPTKKQKIDHVSNHQDPVLEFAPVFVHQIFGDSEQIYGYKNLRVCLSYSAASLEASLEISHTYAATKAYDDVPADDVTATIKEWIDHPLVSADELQSIVARDANWRPMGTLVSSASTKHANAIEIYHCTQETPRFREYLSRVQTFLVWFIDGASYLVLDDDQLRWEVFFAFERHDSKDGLEKQYRFVGMLSMYKHFAYPAHVRPRISQVLILPPFQRQGYGAFLLQAAYDHCLQDSALVRDITVEDPSEEFVKLRDFVDASNSLQLITQKRLRCPYAKDIFDILNKELKINKSQARRVFEILQLRDIKETGIDEKGFRLGIKQRLAQPYQKDIKERQKAKENLSEEELQNAWVSEQEFKQELDEGFKTLRSQYMQIVYRLKRSVLR